MGVVPLQVPLVAVSVLPTARTPEISGGEVFWGAAAGFGRLAVESERAEPEETEFEAVTRTRRGCPASLARRRYV
jgi:hypothetical protein